MEKHLAPYEGDLPYVFISYSHLDIELRDELLAAFNKEGIRFWFDDGLHPSRVKLYKLCEQLDIGITCIKPFAGGGLFDAQRSPFGAALTPVQCMPCTVW